MAATRHQPTDTERYEKLKRSVVDIAVFRCGSLVQRFMPCGKPGCRCQARRPSLHGPYYQWTRKVNGKTVTVRVNEAEAKLFRKWINNGRRLDRLVGEMERVSQRLTEQMLRADRRP